MGAFLSFCIDGLKEVCFNATLPLTKRLLSRKPNPPVVAVQDIRANRIRFDIKSSYSSPFNVEVFEIEWAPSDAPPDEWTSVGFSDILQRTVARLKADTKYRFRFRAKSDRGIGGWCEPVVAKTRQEPIEGGGHGPHYTWTQTPTDITISFKLPKATSKWDVKLLLKTDYLRVQVARPKGHTEPWDEMLLDGQLYGKVASFDNGSFWEIVKDDDSTVLNVMLEKASKSLAPKFDYWRSIQPGHPELEIDTHKIEPDPDARNGPGGPGGGMQMLHPGQMDPDQLRALGLGQYATS